MKYGYLSELPTNASAAMYVACKISEKYKHRLPTWQELARDLCMSRATAYRWLRAIKDARGIG